jgi:replicative DNA helicase
VLTAHEHKAPITASDLARTMLEAGERWDVPPAYLAEMIHEFEHLWMHARFYAEKAHDLWRRNATSGEANSAASFVRRPDIDVDDVLEDLGELRNRYAPPPHLRVESTQAALDAIRDGTSEEDFLPTGWKSIDERFNQRTPGSATIVGGRPSAGKSSVMGHLCMVDSTSCKCSFFTLEMTNQELLERWVKWLMAPPTRLSKESAVEYLRQLDIDVHAGSWDIKDIEKQVISLAVHQPEERPVSVFVDYLQLIGNDDPSERTRHDKVQAISRRLKSLALKTGVILTVGSQLNRQADDKTRPRLAHLRESGALEQDADNVILIWDDPKDAKRERVEIPLLFDKGS